LAAGVKKRIVPSQLHFEEMFPLAWVACYLLILGLSVYGIGSFVTTIIFLDAWLKGKLKPRAIPQGYYTTEKCRSMKVTVQLPIYNEAATIRRLLEASANLDYPNLQIQILDDSTDETTSIVKDFLASYKRTSDTSPAFEHHRRVKRTGYKAGALKEALETATGDFICMFDADFVPRPDFIKHVLHRFESNERLGCIQCRWAHLNEEFSVFTRVQAMGIDGHFIVEQPARCWGGMYLNFNGSCGIWRKSCIYDAGNWHFDTLTEDLDLSIRMQLRGWELQYVSDVTVEGELPIDFPSFKSQQFRWARGSIQCARKLLPSIWSGDRSLFVKLYATYHLYAYGVSVFMLMSVLFVLPTALFVGEKISDVALMYVLVGATGPPLMYTAAAVWLRRPARLLLLPLLVILGYGICLNNTIAVIQGLRDPVGESVEFVRTPKTGAVGKKASNVEKKSYPQLLRAMKEECAALAVVALLMLISQRFQVRVLEILSFFFFAFAYTIFTSIASAS